MPNGRGLKSAAARALLLALLSLLAAVPPARAQSSDEPQLVFTIYGGLSEGSELWHIPKQPLAAPGGQDTVSLTRRLRPGLIAGLVTTYYRSPHFGWSADIGYFGIGSEQGCLGPAVYLADSPQAPSENRQTCESAQGQHVGTNVVGFLGGFTYRFAPEGRVQPFVRVTGGPGLLGNSSFIETIGLFLDTGTCSLGCEERILQNQSKPDITWVVNVAAGMSVSIAPGYRARMEVRDVITRLPVATGPRDPTNPAAEPPMSSVVQHLPTLLFGLDIVLEHRHPRRY